MGRTASDATAHGFRRPRDRTYRSRRRRSESSWDGSGSGSRSVVRESADRRGSGRSPSERGDARRYATSPPARPRAVPTLFTSSWNCRVAAFRPATNMTSAPGASVAPSPRTASRMRRLARLRSTAVPSPRVAETPIRGGRVSPVRSTWTTTAGEDDVRPSEYVRRMSAAEVRRLARCISDCGELRGEPRALLAAASREDRPPARRAHASAEPVGALAASPMRLIGAFHSEES